MIKFSYYKEKMLKIIFWKGWLNWLPDKQFLQVRYRVVFGKKLNLKNPESYNEKLQWLKLYDRNPLYTKLVDKYEVKDYVANIIGKEYIVPTLGVWDRFDDIDVSKLPSKFVLKCTHDSGGVVICSDLREFNSEGARKKLDKSLKHNYFLGGREWPYKNVRPRIIMEQYLEEKSLGKQAPELRDYKMMCFNGKVRCSFVCTERNTDSGLKVTFFDREWNRMPFERHYPQSSCEIEKPYNYEKMIILAEKLAKNIPFVRVDFYEVNQRIYFGELTFYPGSGFECFKPSEWDEILGSWIEIPS